MSKPLSPIALTRSPAAIRWALLGLVVAALGCAASTWRVYGHTWDEPEHLAAGMELLDRGRYEYDVQHPPLARLLIALGPYLAGARSLGKPPPDGTPEGVAILYGSGHYDLYLTLARLGTLPFLALLLVTTFAWARRVCRSEREALLAVLLLAAVPPVLGNAALATLDVPAAATTLLALYLAERWLGSGRWRDAALFGVAAGLAVATKFSAIPFVGIGVAVLALAHSTPELRRSGRLLVDRRAWVAAGAARCASLTAAAALAAVAVALVYGGRFVYLTDASHRYSPTLSWLFGDRGWLHSLAYGVAAHVPVPLALQRLVAGLQALLWHNSTGHRSYLLGDVRTQGWWYFYVVALAVKTPLPLLASGPAGLAVLARDGWRRRDAWRLAPALLFVAILAFASFYSHINIGIRHVLILYPLLAIGAANLIGAAWRALRQVADRDRAGLGCALVAGLVGWQVSALATANPDYLPYFNEAVAHPERVLVDSDLAWGQDLRRLEHRLAELKVRSFSFAYLGTADLARETFPVLRRLAPGQPTTGWVAVTALARVESAGGYAWLDAYVPVETVGKSIDLYYIPEPALPALPCPALP